MLAAEHRLAARCDPALLGEREQQPDRLRGHAMLGQVGVDSRGVEGEPLDAVCERVRAAMGRIAAAHTDGEDVLVVSHGGVISVYACWLLGASFNQLWRLRVDNASLTVARPPRLVSVNDTSHLRGVLAPARLQRAAPTR